MLAQHGEVNLYRGISTSGAAERLRLCGDLTAERIFGFWEMKLPLLHSRGMLVKKRKEEVSLAGGTNTFYSTNFNSISPLQCPCPFWWCNHHTTVQRALVEPKAAVLLRESQSEFSSQLLCSASSSAARMQHPAGKAIHTSWKTCEQHTALCWASTQRIWGYPQRNGD